MLIAKLTDRKGDATFHEIKKVGQVLFDERPGWLLLATPPGARPRKQELRWAHPADEQFEWVRNFNFGG